MPGIQVLALREPLLVELAADCLFWVQGLSQESVRHLRLHKHSFVELLRLIVLNLNELPILDHTQLDLHFKL